MSQQAIEFQGRLKKGVRQVTMALHHEFNTPYNHKSVHRIMRKYGLLSPNFKIYFVLETFDELAANPNVKLMKRSIVHSVKDLIIQVEGFQRKLNP